MEENKPQKRRGGLGLLAAILAMDAMSSPTLYEPSIDTSDLKPKNKKSKLNTYRAKRIEIDVTQPKYERNKPCHCSSGLKYKKCCIKLEDR